MRYNNRLAKSFAFMEPVKIGSMLEVVRVRVENENVEISLNLPLFPSSLLLLGVMFSFAFLPILIIFLGILGSFLQSNHIHIS